MADEKSSHCDNTSLLSAQYNKILVNFDTAAAAKATCENTSHWGFLLGSVKDNVYDVIGVINCIEKYDIFTKGRDASKFPKSDKDRIISEILSIPPEGLDIIGIFCFSNSVKFQIIKSIKETLVPFQKEYGVRKIFRNLLILKADADKQFDAEFLIINKNNETENKISRQSVEIIYSDSVGKDWMLDKVALRLKASLPCQISIGRSEKNMNKESHRILSKLKDHPHVLLFDDSDAIISEKISDKDWNDVKCEINKKKQGNQITEIKLLTSLCKNDLPESDTYCPILMFSSFPEEYLELSLELDTIIYSDLNCQIDGFMHSCVNSLCIQATNMLLHEQREHSLHKDMKAYHYNLESLNHMITVLYPDFDTNGKAYADDDLVNERKTLHEMLLLPKRKPLIKKGQNHFHQLNSDYLINPHLNLKSGITEGICCIVEGKYAYHHYMQDYFDDNGWGCAYRSLQTICSWFRLQGFTTKSIPSHKEIQDALVAVDDKPKSFSGSRQWIGSFEVSLCLEKLINVSSKILHVSSGAEMASKGRELLDHFKDQGTPVMIGGGVLAHTILGVHFNELSGEIKFLILDPHYTGAENLKTVQDKGWCGWKGPSFWDQTAHYNMCLPQRPDMI